MKDYSKYYIQGSDHYLIPKDEFENQKEKSDGRKNDKQNKRL